MSENTEAFQAHIRALEQLALDGDEMATRSLCAIVLSQSGWRPGDPDPVDPDDGPDGGEIIYLDFARAA